ncbi:MAG TPA: hypothetical protein VFU86_12245, partial [Terriglobales bacterium]|nr:hypothetical protein [Terriglobales bacterium]
MPRADVLCLRPRVVVAPRRLELREDGFGAREVVARLEPVLAGRRFRVLLVRLRFSPRCALVRDCPGFLAERPRAPVELRRERVDCARVRPARRFGWLPAAISRAISLLKLLFCPSAVVCWW